MSVTVDDLYEQFAVIVDDTVNDPTKHKDAFLKIIEGTKGGPSEKKLACQFICRFFKQFPEHMAQALDAVFQLCKDNDTAIRRQAIHDLPLLAKCCLTNLDKVADILTQLLQADDHVELTLVHKALISLIDLDTSMTLRSVFRQIRSCESIQVRRRAVRFLLTKVATFDESRLTKEMEELLITFSKESLGEVDPESFIGLVQFMQKFQSIQTLTARQELVSLITQRAHLDQPWEVNDTDRLVFLLSCMQHALPLFSRNVHSSQMTLFMIDHICPFLTRMECADEEKLQMYRLLAELCFHCGNDIERIDERIEKVFDLLLFYLPPPPENLENNALIDPHFDFSFIECVLYAFHCLCKLQPSFLSEESRREKLKDFKIRLQFLAQGLQHYQKQLKAGIQGKPDDLKSNENKVRMEAMKVFSNLQTLLKDFFHNPPSLKTNIILSWKTAQELPTKRMKSDSDSASFERKLLKPERQLYQPPSGKYSNSGYSYEGNGRRPRDLGLPMRRKFNR